MRFVDLQRTFIELPKNAGVRGDGDLGISALGGSELTWPDIFGRFRTIVLSEAGSGKTSEIRQATVTLRGQGKQAFFLRLEHVSDDFEDAFEVGTIQEFESWLGSEDDGWILLDSIDEARLRNPSDFERAIRKVSRRIEFASALHRSHVIITGRTTAWRPKTDLDLCNILLPIDARRMKLVPDEEQPENADLQLEVQEPANLSLAFRVVALKDLDSKQVESFAEAKGVENPSLLLEAIDRGDAWAFTTRPQDLEELVQFWIDKGRIGTRLDVMQNSINRRLTERDQGRADVYPISPERALLGARLLAAATTLTKQPTIRVPDGTENAHGIPIEQILADWDDKERATLLSRPIFDEAIYGTVRFHHRSVREFLAAEWLAELLKRQTSRRKIETLIFHRQYGIDVLVPSIRPLLPWLALADEKLRKRIHDAEPMVFLEGGDPSRLPLETRRDILRRVCKQIIDDSSGSSVPDYAAAQRFAKCDLAADVKKLIQDNSNNDDVLSFLMRMIWLGEIKEAISEAKRLAISTRHSKYTRLAAVKAVRAVGSSEVRGEVRERLLRGNKDVEPLLIEELIADLEPREKDVVWLFNALNRTPAPKQYSSDGLKDAVANYFQRCSVELLPHIIHELNCLLETQPIVEATSFEISQRFGWLLQSAAIAAKLLVLARHPASLSNECLAILFKLSESVHCTDYEVKDNQLSELVRGWPELNRAYFWFSVGKTLQRGDSRFTEYWHVAGTFWRFDSEDFQYILDELNQRVLPEERQFSLSLAFHLYVKGGREKKQRRQLNEAVKSQDELSKRLAKYMKPPARADQSLNRVEVRFRRQREKWEKKNATNEAKWKSHLKSNVDHLRNNGLKPGIISNSQFYLQERMRRSKPNGSMGWSHGDLGSIATEFGENVATAFRDGALKFWREFVPRLRSEGAPENSIPHEVVFGLIGLAIDARETVDWPKKLTDSEIELACRYACLELNGFPAWLPTLFKAAPKAVGGVLLKEIQYELSGNRAAVASAYVLYNLSWSGQWMWDDVAPVLYNCLKLREPTDLNYLGYLLKILEGSSMTDTEISRLASRKCKQLKRLINLARWFSTWVATDPDVSLPVLEDRMKRISNLDARTAFAMQFITQLLSARYGNVARYRQAFCSPKHLKRLYLLMHKFIPAKNDTRRAGMGVYSPGLRDVAQDARERLAGLIRDIPGKEAFLALCDIAKVHPQRSYRSWFANLAKAKAEQDADIEAWSPQQVREFHVSLERMPRNHQELSELVNLRLLDLKDDLEHGDSSIAKILQTVELETDMRKFIGRELRDKALGRYSVPQEEELADAKKPDLRVHGAGFDGPVPCELKLADKWSANALFERLENQLCGDYLRDSRSSYGFFLLVHQGRGKRAWKDPNTRRSLDFSELVLALRQHWTQISPSYPNIDDIEAIGIDLTQRFD